MSNIVKPLSDAGADPILQVSGRRFPGKSPLQMAQTWGNALPKLDGLPEITQAILTLLLEREL